MFNSGLNLRPSGLNFTLFTHKNYYDGTNSFTLKHNYDDTIIVFFPWRQSTIVKLTNYTNKFVSIYFLINLITKIKMPSLKRNYFKKYYAKLNILYIERNVHRAL